MSTAPQFAIERLSKRHDRSQFDCGQASLNDWLRMRSSQFDRRDLARTYVLVQSGESVVLGYYALTTHRVRYDALPADEAKGLPQIDIPVILLGRLAVDQSIRGQGCGELLLLDALRRCELISDQVGVRAVEVDAIDSAAQQFYRKYGFLELLDDPHHLLLPMSDIRQLNLGA
jgi:predicted GNAT family N-acyltransferase